MGKIMYNMWVYHGISTVNDFLPRIWEAGLGGLCFLCGRQDCFVLRQASEGSTTSAVSQAAKDGKTTFSVKQKKTCHCTIFTIGTIGSMVNNPS